jgi:hypothetical protein
LETKLSLEIAKSPYIPLKNNNDTSDCIMIMASTSNSNQEFKEVGVLLPETLNNLNAWTAFLKTIHLPDLQMIGMDGPDSARHRGGNVAGNLLWLLQSLGRTVARTKELVKVHYLCNRH